MNGFSTQQSRLKEARKSDAGRIALAYLLVSLAACTQTRPQQWPDGVAQDIFEKSYLNSQSAWMTLSDQISPQAVELGLLAMNESEEHLVAKVEADKRLLPMFSDLKVFGQPGARIEVKFEVGTKKVTAFKVVSIVELAQLPILERQISKTKGVEAWVPVFEFEIESQGVVEAVKNDLGENTRTLQITATNAEKSTHVQISTLRGNRLVVGVQPSDRATAKEVFLKDQLENGLFTREELNRKLQINISEAGLYLSKLGGETLSLFKVQKLSELTDDFKQLIGEQDRGANLATKDVRRCTDAEKAIVPAALMNECTVVLAYEVNQITYVNAERQLLDKDGTVSNAISFTPSLTPGGAAFIRIAKDPAVRSINKEEQVTRLDPRNTLALADIKGKEFLLRRTMKDSPNTFAYTFAGASGGLEIVEFVAEDKQLRVVRADALLQTSGSTAVDRETLLLLPARYFKIVNVDDKGNPIAQPRMVNAHFSEVGAVANVDWSQNTIPTINSPLDFFGVEQCFSQLSERKVSEVDHRLGGDGMLNFTLTSTYAGNRGSFDCAGIESAGYFDTVQKTFTFEERISFKQYVKPASEAPLLDVPYEAQKALGFGLFTYKKKQPNGNGLTHVDGTEIPLPAIFDIQNGQTIKYVLAGLPKGSDAKSGEIRAKITKATREVVDDLNHAFREALRGSAQARNSDVIQLLVEGIDSDAGQLGDLDRNHIFYVEKATDSGVIGLGGAHANPRSGIVESASVYLYGGNMMSMVDSLRRLAKAKEAYDANMAVESEAIDSSTEEGPSVAIDGSAGAPAARGQDEEAAALRPALKTARVKALAAKLNPALRSLKIARTLKQSSLRKNRAALRAAVKARADVLQRLQPEVLRAETKDLKRGLARMSGQQKMYARAFNELIGERKLRDPEAIAQSLFKFRTNGSTQRGLSVKAKMRAANICLFDRSALDAMMAGALVGENQILQGMSDLDILADIWKGTLAHEIGHNLGLRHNFEGSFDAANWKFNAAEDTKRDYSSIMDYLQDDHLTYDGMGPQDVASLRAAYAGLLELNEGVLGAVRTDALGQDYITSAARVKTPVVAKKYVRIGDYRKSIGLTTWLDMTSDKTANLPIKAYKFCSDEEAGMRPTCNRFDKGSTPGEIVGNIVSAYKERYSLSNFANDRLVFNDGNLDGYVGRLFDQFLTIRQFLEETYYQAIVVRADDDTVNHHVDAAIQGLLFFNDLIRTPDAPNFAANDERFVRVTKDVPREDGSGVDRKTYTIERKWLKSIANGNESDRNRVRGIELDKTIATIMLTNRDFGFPRYEAASLRMTYTDLEKLLVGAGAPTSALPTVALLKEILADHVMPAAMTPDGTIDAPASSKVEVSELMRNYAALGAVIDLDAVGFTAQDNVSSAFRMMSQLGSVASDMPFITQPGAANDVRYYAYPEAEVARSLVNQGSTLAAIRTLKPGVQGLVNEWLKLANGIPSLDENGAEIPLPTGPSVRLSEIEALVDGQLSQLPESAGPRSLGEMGGLFAEVLAIARQIDELTQQYPAELFAEDIAGLHTELESMTKISPTLAVMFDSIGGPELGSDNFDGLSPAGTTDFAEYSTFRNAQVMNDLLLAIHPEYRK